MQKLIPEFEIIPAEGEETCGENRTPREMAERLSGQKAAEVRDRLYADGTPREDYLVIGADTVVEMDGRALGKPADVDAAADMLRRLSGAEHRVYTGVTLLACCGGGRREVSFSEETRVVFYSMQESEIADYIRTGEPMDKAGSYGIQGIGGRFVKEICGSYDNVVGLPTAQLYQKLRALGLWNCI